MKIQILLIIPNEKRIHKRIACSFKNKNENNAGNTNTNTPITINKYIINNTSNNNSNKNIFF
jgi:hypothetical protein